jgi:hypothetical protein
LKKRAKEAEKQKKAAEKAARQQELAEKQASAEAVGVVLPTTLNPHITSSAFHFVGFCLRALRPLAS